MKYIISARTDIGRKRSNNEDNFSVNERYMPPPALDSYTISLEAREGVFSVCDGMGGEAYGEYASLSGVKTFAENYQSILCSDLNKRKKAVARCIRSANADICAEMDRKNARIGSTAVLACIKENRADIFNIGDSRAYLFRNGKLRQLSKDHTVLQQKIDLGIITDRNAAGSSVKNRLTQHLGIFESEMVIEAYHTETNLNLGDIILLCSDGLTDMVSDEEISAACGVSRNISSTVSALVDKALEHGGNDNVTVIAVYVEKNT